MTAELTAELRAAGLTDAAEPLAAVARPAIRLCAAPADRDALRAGATRIGGAPHLSPDAPWPTRDGRPLAFLTQIDLADIHRLPAATELPKAGLLQFFFDTDAAPTGLDPGDRGAAVVRFEPARAGTVARRSPTGFDALPACAVAAVSETTLPPPDSFVVEALQLSERDRTTYASWWRRRQAADTADGLPCHRLLGHASPLAGDMQLDCQLASHGIRSGRPESLVDPRTAALATGAADWRLLLQLDSDITSGVTFLDGGRLFFWIPETALREADFAACWCIAQDG